MLSIASIQAALLRKKLRVGLCSSGGADHDTAPAWRGCVMLELLPNPSQSKVATEQSYVLCLAGSSACSGSLDAPSMRVSMLEGSGREGRCQTERAGRLERRVPRPKAQRRSHFARSSIRLLPHDRQLDSDADETLAVRRASSRSHTQGNIKSQGWSAKTSNGRRGRKQDHSAPVLHPRAYRRSLTSRFD